MNPFDSKVIGPRIAITDHAAQRYVDRVDGSISPRVAKRYLVGALGGVPLRIELPWVATRDQGGWLAEITPGVAVVVRPGRYGDLAGTTVITRGAP